MRRTSGRTRRWRCRISAGSTTFPTQPQLRSRTPWTRRDLRQAPTTLRRTPRQPRLRPSPPRAPRRAPVTPTAATASQIDPVPSASFMSAPAAPTAAALVDTDADPVATVSKLIVTRRFGLAAALAKQAEMAEPWPMVLRLSALADAVRGETGPCASRLRLELPTLDADQFAADAVALRLAVPALIRVALVTGEHAAGALLTTLSAH